MGNCSSAEAQTGSNSKDQSSDNSRKSGDKDGLNGSVSGRPASMGEEPNSSVHNSDQSSDGPPPTAGTDIYDSGDSVVVTLNPLLSDTNPLSESKTNASESVTSSGPQILPFKPIFRVQHTQSNGPGSASLMESFGQLSVAPHSMGMSTDSSNIGSQAMSSLSTDGGFASVTTMPPPTPTNSSQQLVLGTVSYHLDSRLLSRHSRSTYTCHYLGVPATQDTSAMSRFLPLAPSQRRLLQQQEIQAFDVHDIPPTFGLGIAWPVPQPPTSGKRGSTTILSPFLTSNSSPSTPVTSQDGPTLSRVAANQSPTRAHPDASVWQADCRSFAGLDDHLIPTVTSTTKMALQQEKRKKEIIFNQALQVFIKLLDPKVFRSPEGQETLAVLHKTLLEAGFQKLCSVVIFLMATYSDIRVIGSNPLDVCRKVRNSTCASHFEKEYFEDHNIPVETRKNLLDFDLASAAPGSVATSRPGGFEDDLVLADPAATKAAEEVDTYVKYLGQRWEADIEYALVVGIVLICLYLDRPVWTAPPTMKGHKVINRDEPRAPVKQEESESNQLQQDSSNTT